MADQASSLLGPDARTATPATAHKLVPLSNIDTASPPASFATAVSPDPSPLRRSKARLLSGILVDVILGGVAALFLVLAVLVRSHEHEPVAEHRELVSSLQEAMQYGSTLFPILFAAAVSRGLRSLMMWRLERGANIGLLDTLAGSTTVFNTVATQLNLRTPTIFGAVLILIWGLSPVGSQASLRVMSTANSYNHRNTTLQYTDTTFWFLNFYDSENVIALVNALFTASLLSPAATKRSSMDTWGKMKIPMIETLDNRTAMEEGWMAIPSDTTYSALSGLYMSGLAGSANTSITLETSYMVVNCPFVQDSFPSSVNVSWSSGPSAKIYSPSSTAMTDGTGLEGRNATARLPPRVFYYDTGLMLPERNTTYQYDYLDPAANCTLQTSYVEVEAACDGRNCSVAKMRPSRLPHNTTAWTVLDRDRTWGYWSDNFVKSVYGHDASATPKETYFVDPDSPGSPSTCGGYSAFGLPKDGCSDAQIARALDPRAFGISLTQLMNTYWLSNAGPELTTNSIGTSSTQVCYQFKPPPNPNITCEFVSDAPAVVTTSTEIIICHHGWLVAIIVASVVMIASTGLHAITALLREYGDLLLNVSTLVRDDAHDGPMQVPSTAEDAELSRMLRRYDVRLGDVRPADDVGQIGIRLLAEGGKVTRLRKGRLYN